MTAVKKVDLILVPQGAEYRAVTSGLRSAEPNNPIPTLAIPVGQQAVRAFLARVQLPDPPDIDAMDGDVTDKDRSVLNVVVMGLCGGLATSMTVGQRVIPDRCTEYRVDDLPSGSLSARSFSAPLLDYLRRVLDEPTALSDLSLGSDSTVAGKDSSLVLSSDRAICLATDKQRLHRDTGATVVDMEGAAVLEILSDRQVNVAMVRVVSDDCSGDLPDLNAAIAADGSLSPIALTLQMMRYPARAGRLIVGSLRALRALSAVAKDIGVAARDSEVDL